MTIATTGSTPDTATALSRSPGCTESECCTFAAKLMETRSATASLASRDPSWRPRPDCSPTVRNAANSVQNVVTYTIVADVQNDSLQLRPGMTANVTIVTAEVSDVLKVPNAALRFKPANESPR